MLFCTLFALLFLLYDKRGADLKEALTMYEVLDILQDDNRVFEKKIADLMWEEKKGISSLSEGPELSSDDTDLD
jgi:hypothetical protein